MAYRIFLEIDPADVTSPHTPVAVTLDFDALLPGVPVRPETISVALHGREIPHRQSVDFRYGNRGDVLFVVEDPGSLEYVITLSAGRRERAAAPAFLPPIGVGDPLHHNAGRPLLLTTFGAPQINDLAGDGTPHLTDAIYWSSYYGWPHNVILHRAAVDGRSGLEFGPVAALRACAGQGGDPAIVSEDFYIRHHVVDWDGDGRLDLVTVNSGARHVKFYRNTGEKEPTGCPIFNLVETFPATQTSGYLGLKLVDLFRDGRLHLVIGGNEHLPGREKDPYTSYIQVYENLAGPGEVPRFSDPQRLRTEDGQDIRFEGTGWDFAFSDLDGDRNPDLLYARSSGPHPLVWYRNLGPYRAGHGMPVFRLEGPPEGLEAEPRRDAPLGWASCGAWEGPIVNGRLYRVRVDAQRRCPVFHAPAPVMTANPELNGGDQPGPHPCDWDGDGDLDLLAGLGEGHLQLWENTGARRRPAFAERVRLRSCGQEIRIWRDAVFGGHHWHGMMGYTQPVYADWDGDGIPDLLVANETNRIFYFPNQGTRERPLFGPMRQVEVEGFEDSPEKREKSRLRALGETPYPFEREEAFWWRQKAAVVDWNGDGLPDLVAVDGEGYYCLFERFRRDGLRLRKALRFQYEDGGFVTHDSLPRETTGVDGIVVCDWQGRGRWDILVGTCYTVFYLENRGDNRTPRFARPVRLRLWGEEIRHSRHGLLGHAVDWDGDGRLSYLSGSESGMLFLFRRAALDAGHPPRVTIKRIEEGP